MKMHAFALVLASLTLSAQAAEPACDRVWPATELVCKSGSRNVKVSIPKQSHCEVAIKGYLNDTIPVSFVSSMVPMNISVPLDKTEWGMYLIGPGDRIQEFLGPCIDNGWNSL